jgi:hypothetical protein
LIIRSFDFTKEWAVRSTDVFPEVVQEIMRLTDMATERIVGMDSSVVTDAAKKKASFFSENIVNLEKKLYEEIFRKPDDGPVVKLMTPEATLELVIEGLPTDLHLGDVAALEEACRYSYLKRFLLRQAISFNHLLQTIRKDMINIKARIIGSFKDDSKIDSIIEVLIRGEVPKSWKEQSRKDRLALPAWLKRLKDQYDFFSKLVENSFVKPNVFNLKVISDPKGLIDAYHLDCTNQRAPNMSFDEIVLTFKLTTVFERNAGGLPFEGIFLLGLKFEHGLLDRLRGDLLEKADISTTDECPAIQVLGKYAKKVVEKSDAKVFSCPVVDLNCVNKNSLAFKYPLCTLVN